MRARRPLAALVPVALLVALTACSSSSSGTAATPSATEQSDDTSAAETTVADTEAPTTLATVATTVPITLPPTVPRTVPPVTLPTVPDTVAPTDTADGDADAPDPEVIEAKLRSVMLTPADIDPSFVEGEWPGPAEATPCGVKVDELVPYSAIGGVLLSSSSLQLAMVESIRVYELAADGDAAFATALEGFGCTEGAGGVTIADSADLTETLGVPAIAYSLTGEGFEAVLILAAFYGAFISFQFQGAPGAAAASGLTSNPVEIADLGIRRLRTAIAGG